MTGVQERTPSTTSDAVDPVEATRRPTRQRAAVAAVLADTGEFRSAQELHALLREAGDKVGLATVYRNLQAMAADGEIDMLRTDEGEAVYRACSTGHHHHLVCRDCGRTVEVEGPTVEAWTTKVSAEHGFTDVHHTLEIFGTCADCSR
ncbi:transcriptional repressor [Pedococcus aerophilus]|uniref:Transcriptional repressor n=1 Tax=Pedococcus aerophilus TaxID=436356 RepID=A0ABN3UVA4_9MICO